MQVTDGDLPWSWLLVIAHPDDECMFFYPTLKTLVRRGCSLHILSLSNGGADGLGPTRTKEMRKAAMLHGVATATVVDDPLLRDGMHTRWDQEAVARCVEAHLARMPGDHIAVVTFDDCGASGHPNHIAASAGVRAFLSQGFNDVRLARRIAHYELESASIWWRYLGPLAIALSWLFAKRDCLVFVNMDTHAAYCALSTHASQFVWYRKVFVVISAYTYYNCCRLVGTLVPMKPR